MQSHRSLRRVFLMTAAVAVVGTAGLVVQFQGDRGPTDGLNSVAAAEKPMSDMARMWPVFGGTPARNMVNAFDTGMPSDWETRKNETKKNLKWIAKLGSRAYGGPTIAAGKVFVGTNNESPRNKRDTDPKKRHPVTKEPTPIDKGVLMCFRESDGKFLWQHVNDKLPSGQVHDWPREGVCSTPVVDGNRVYYVSNRCAVVCLDVEGMSNGNQGDANEQYKDETDADVIWQYDMMKELNVFPHNMAACSPVIVGDVIFVITANGVDEGHINIPSPDAPSFVALDKNTGKLLWKDASPGKQIMHGQWSNPTFADIGGRTQIIFPGGDGWLYAFEPKTGNLLWKFDANPKKAARYELGGKGERNDFIATPVIYDNKIYIGVGQDPEHYEGIGHLYCIDPAGKSGDISPELVVKDDPDPTKRQTKPNPNSGQVWHYGGLDKNPDAKRDYVFGRTMSTCAIKDDILYVGELAGYLHCLNAKTGALYWVHDLKSEIWGSPYWVDGKVYIGVGDGDIFIFAHNKEKKLLGKVTMDEPIRSTPVAVGTVLYVMSEYNLFAIEEKK